MTNEDKKLVEAARILVAATEAKRVTWQKTADDEVFQLPHEGLLYTVQRGREPPSRGSGHKYTFSVRVIGKEEDSMLASLEYVEPASELDAMFSSRAISERVFEAARSLFEAARESVFGTKAGLARMLESLKKLEG